LRSTSKRGFPHTEFTERTEAKPFANGLLSVFSVVSVCEKTLFSLVLLVLCGCASEEKRALEDSLVGRWRGEAVDPPNEVWFSKAVFDFAFSDTSDFSAVVATYDRQPHELRFEGEYDVEDGRVVKIEERNLGGDWTVERRGPDEILMSRGDMKLTLRKRYGS
jgi:hypothetical protein